MIDNFQIEPEILLDPELTCSEKLLISALNLPKNQLPNIEILEQITGIGKLQIEQELEQLILNKNCSFFPALKNHENLFSTNFRIYVVSILRSNIRTEYSFSFNNNEDKELRSNSDSEYSSSTRTKLNEEKESSLLKTFLFEEKEIEKTKIEIPPVPLSLQPFVSLWQANGLYLAKPNTKSFANDLKALPKLINGSFFRSVSVPRKYNRRYEISEWKQAVDRFGCSVKDPKVHPLKKDNIRKTSIHQFLFNPFLRSKAVSVPNSLFLHYLENEPIPINSAKTSKNAPGSTNVPNPTPTMPEGVNVNPLTIFPCTVQTIREVWMRFLTEYRPDEKPVITDSDLERFELAVEKTEKFFKLHQNKIPDFYRYFYSPSQKAKHLLESVVTSCDPDTITPGYLCSQMTLEKRLPNYLRENRYLT